MSVADPVYRRLAPTPTSVASPPRSTGPSPLEQISSLDTLVGRRSTETTANPFRVLTNKTTEGPTPGARQPFTRDSLAEILDVRARWRSSSMLDPLGMFLLQTISDADEGIPLPDVADRLRGPDGWVAVARLIRAGLLDENGLTIYATPSGRLAAETTRGLAPAADE